MSLAPFNPYHLSNRIRRAVVACALSLALFVGTALADIWQPPPEGTAIAEVEVRGLKRLDPDSVSRVMSLRPGVGFSTELLRQDQQAISNLGTIDPVSIEIAYEDTPAGVKIIVNARENPLLSRIQVVGNIKYSQKTILAQIDFKAGDTLPTAARANTLRSLRNFYALGGYKNARIDVTIEPVAEAEGDVQMSIVIDEGEKIRINDLIIRGNKHFSTFWMRLQLVNQGSWFIFDNYYDERSFETDLRSIEAKYRDAGFLDARARRGEFIYKESNATVSPVIEITEGNRYTVRAVEIKGATLFNNSELSAFFKRQIGIPYNGEMFSDSVDAIRGMYGRQGYVDTEVNGRFDKDGGGQTLTLVVEVNEAPSVRVGQIRLSRSRYDYQFDLNLLQRMFTWLSAPTKDETVLKEVRLEPGKQFSTTDEQRTITRLKNLRIFKNVTIRREPTSDPNVQDAVIELAEDPNAGYFLISAGIAESSGPAVGLSYTNPNLFGDGDILEMGVTFGPRTRNLRMRYFDRYIGDSKTSYDIQLYRDYDRYRSYSQRVYGMSHEFGRPMNEYRDAYLRFRLEQTNFSNIQGSPREDFDSYVTAAVRLRVNEDRTDSRIFPTRGYAISGGVETGVADGFLLKLTHTYDRYFPLSEDWVYAYGHTVGLMPYDATNIGLGERFFLGGSRDLRGFAPREVGPRDPDSKRLAIGGATKITQRHELRYAFSKRFRGRIFTDIGLLDERAFSLGKPRIGVGPGFSADLGPIVLDIDIGFAAVKGKHDRTRILSFRVGSNF
jgi:outer membrane protein insertion porin family